jgi:hypothetical protein
MSRGFCIASILLCSLTDGLETIRRRRRVPIFVVIRTLNHRRLSVPGPRPDAFGAF